MLERRLLKPRRTLVVAVPMTLVAAVTLSGALLQPELAQGVSDEPAFAETWSRTDLPIQDGAVSRTWFWGPEPRTPLLEEPNSLAPTGTQTVQYFDKARMELPDRTADPEAPGYVLTGLLASELVGGVAQINIAGDLDDPAGVTYATIAGIVDETPHPADALITTRLGSDGALTEDGTLAERGVRAEYYIVETDHTIASVFWEFFNSSGTVWNNGEFEQGRLFPDPFFGAGFPITEAFWTTVRVGGEPRDVLLQCFQRRCLTYTPDNPDGWQVESNNAGAHYYTWRYPGAGASPTATPMPAATATAAPTTQPSPTSEQPAALPQGEYSTAGGEIHAMHFEVAATFATRACGLMHRDELPDDTGMLFVFEQDNSGGFWNCNTFVSLTLAWISADGTIIGFSDMEPQTRGEDQHLTTYQPPGPYRYVVEANRGWFAERGIQVGDHVDLAEALVHGDTQSDTLCQQLGLACN